MVHALIDLFFSNYIYVCMYAYFHNATFAVVSFGSGGHLFAPQKVFVSGALYEYCENTYIYIHTYTYTHVYTNVCLPVYRCLTG